MTGQRLEPFHHDGFVQSCRQRGMGVDWGQGEAKRRYLQLLRRALSGCDVLRSFAQAHQVLLHEHYHSLHHPKLSVPGGLPAASRKRGEDNSGVECAADDHSLHVDGSRQNAADVRIDISHQ